MGAPCSSLVNPLLGTLKPQINGIRRLIHWPLMGGLLHLVQRGGAWAGCGPAQSPPRCTKCNSPPINDQCTNFILFDVALELPSHSKGVNCAISYRPTVSELDVTKSSDLFMRVCSLVTYSHISSAIGVVILVLAWLRIIVRIICWGRWQWRGRNAVRYKSTLLLHFLAVVPGRQILTKLQW